MMSANVASRTTNVNKDSEANSTSSTVTSSPLDNGFSLITLEQSIALVEVKDGIEVNAKMANLVCEHINASLKGSYGVIFNRNHSYSILPKDVYQVINQQERLVALAIVTYNDISKAVAKSESVYCQRPFNCFSTVSSAHKWLRDLIG